MIDETLESAAGDLDEARSKINATREALVQKTQIKEIERQQPAGKNLQPVTNRPRPFVLGVESR